MPLPMLTGIAHAILGRTPDPLVTPPATVCSEDMLTGMRYVTARGLSGAARVSHDDRMTALSGLESMLIRHPARLAKLLDSAQRDDDHMFRAIGVLIEYARTRRP